MRTQRPLSIFGVAAALAVLALTAAASAVISFTIAYEMTSPSGDNLVSDAAGARVHRGAVPTATSTAEPTLREILLAADELAQNGLLPAPEPTPTLSEILLAADELVRAGLIEPPPEPSLREILLAADELLQAGIIGPPQPSLREILLAADELARAGALPVRSFSAPPPPPPPPTATPVPSVNNGVIDPVFSQRVLALVNERRAAAGLAPVVAEPRLQAAAEGYALTLTAHRWFDHTGPDGSTLVDRVTATGFPFDTQLGEVLAWGGDWTPEGVVQAWMDSPSHREQLMEPIYRRAGSGCAIRPEDGYLVVRCVMDFAG